MFYLHNYYKVTGNIVRLDELIILYQLTSRMGCVLTPRFLHNFRIIQYSGKDARCTYPAAK